MFQFIKEYIQHPTKIGAIAPSSRYLADKMTESVDFDHCSCIVEYGPGTGIFTKKIIEQKQSDTLFIIIEQNEQFYQQLQKRYGKVKGVEIIHGDAQELPLILDQYHIKCVDYIISGLPFASLPFQVSEKILKETKKAIGLQGRFITFQYTLFKMKFFLRHFAITECKKEYRNLPPAYVLTMSSLD